MRCGILVGDFWDLTPHETYLTIEAWMWRDEREQKKQIALAWRTAALTRTKKLPSLKQLFSDGPAKPLVGKELLRRRREFKDMTANVDLKAIAEKMKPHD